MPACCSPARNVQARPRHGARAGSFCASASMPPVPHAGSSSLRTVPGVAKQPIVVDEQDAHHQPDDFAWREVIAGRLVGQLR